MAGVSDRVQEFLSSWPKIKEHLEEVLKDDEGLLYGDGVGRSLPGEPEDDLQETLGQADPGFQNRKVMEDCEEGYRMVEAIILQKPVKSGKKKGLTNSSNPPIYVAYKQLTYESK